MQPVRQPRPPVRSSPDRKCRRLDRVQTGAGRRAFPSAQQQRRSLLRHGTYTRAKTPIYAHTRARACLHTHTLSHARPARTHSLVVSLSAARECPVGAVRVMAQYAALSDELEYLQAYEDVLEKYKGSISGGVSCCRCCPRCYRRRGNGVSAAWQCSKCQPVLPLLSCPLLSLAALRVSTPALEKREYLLHYIIFSTVVMMLCGF